ncbi:MAG: restriction endonuclease subunit S [Chitinophagaceae bacterium]|nr:restriction endonuclease subunit S [Chitinophagaceae bacterium]
MSEWKEYKFSDFADINPKVPTQAGVEYSFIEMPDLEAGYKFVGPSRKREAKGLTKFQNGDTLFAKITPCLENGKICQARNLENNIGVGSTEFIIFRGKENISDTEFIHYLLKFTEVKDYAIKNMSGSAGQQRVPLEAFDNLLIPLPPLPEQQSIAAILSSLDNKIDLLRRQNQTLEQLAQTIFKQWFIHYKYPGATGEMEETELGDVPKGWRTGKFIDVINLLSGGTPKTDIEEFWNGNISWISGKDVTANHGSFIMSTEKKITQAGINNSATKLLPRLTTIITARGTVGSYCILPEPMCISQSNYGIKSKYNKADFFTYLLTEYVIDFLKAKAYGSVFDTITTSTFEDTDIIIPLSEIITEFEISISPLFLKKLNNSKEIQTLSQLRDSLLPRLMSGRLRAG